MFDLIVEKNVRLPRCPRRLNLTQNELKIKSACVTSDTVTSCVYWQQIEILRKTLDQIR